MSQQPQQPRPILKLKVGSSKLPDSSKPAANGANGTNDSHEPPSQTPVTASTPKLKLKLGGPKKAPAATPTELTPPKPKIKLKTTKPKPDRITPKKKRDHDSIAEPGDDEGSAKKPKVAPKIKFKQVAKTPTGPAFIKIKQKNKPPPRPRGLAYDSEASDREDDPAIEEEFVLRMIPGDDCEYIRTAIEKRQWGPRSKGGADIRLRFLQSNGRRATLTVRGTIYAAALVDMPCIVEGMKSWDRKAWYKAADICQMLLVLGTIKTEAEAADYPLPPREVDKDSFAYAHGLTPPLRWVRKRRFRPRVSTRTIEAVEEEVERLLNVDAQAATKVDYELVDLDRLSRGPSGRGDSAQPESEAEDQQVEFDANGDVEADAFFDEDIGEEDEDALAAQFELAGQEEEMGEGTGTEAPTPAESSSAAHDAQQVTDSEAATPAAGATSKEDSGDEESDEDDEIDDIDEDAMEQRADIQRAREEISDLEAVIKDQLAEMERLGNPILKRRKLDKIQSLRSDLELKKAAIGEGEDD
ncbi:MAG: hypothetical protein MMC23_004658 [Stictis urceolatum]|nr:hypothetical protein [Stictis urceolata]